MKKAKAVSSKAKAKKAVSEARLARYKREDSVIHLQIDDKYTLKAYPVSAIKSLDAQVTRIVAKMKKHNTLISQDKFKSALPVERNVDRMITRLNAFLEKTDKKSLQARREGETIKTRPSQWMNASVLWKACDPAPKAKAVKKASKRRVKAKAKAPKAKASKAPKKAKAKAPKAEGTVLKLIKSVKKAAA